MTTHDVLAYYKALSWSLPTFGVTLLACWALAPKGPAPRGIWLRIIASAMFAATMIGIMVISLGGDFVWKVW